MRHDRSNKSVTVVTSAHLSHTDDIALRQRRYVLTQSIRIVCVILATTLPVAMVYKGLFLLLAIALPWFGVVMANAGPTRSRHHKDSRIATPVEQPQQQIAITPGRIIDAER